MEKNKNLNDLQNGFRVSRLCETQLVSFIQALVKSSITSKTLIDFAKSFDIQNKNKIWRSLGTVLGLCLFPMYINDFDECKKHSKLRLFVGISIIYKTIWNKEDT